MLLGTKLARLIENNSQLAVDRPSAAQANVDSGNFGARIDNGSQYRTSVARRALIPPVTSRGMAVANNPAIPPLTAPHPRR